MDISVTDFKAQCLDLIRKVEESGKAITIRRHGQIVARLEPACGPSGEGKPWEELRDDPDVPVAIRVDHERRRAIWLKAQAAEKAISVKSAAQRASKAAKTKVTTTR